PGRRGRRGPRPGGAGRGADRGGDRAARRLCGLRAPAVRAGRPARGDDRECAGHGGCRVPWRDQGDTAEHRSDPGGPVPARRPDRAARHPAGSQPRVPRGGPAAGDRARRWRIRVHRRARRRRTRVTIRPAQSQASTEPGQHRAGRTEVFRRRRQQDAQAGPADQETWDEPAGEEDEEGEEAAGSTPAEPGWGPWDATEDVPEAERIDFGSLQVPVTEGSEIQLNIAEDQGPLIVVVRGDSSLQLQAFAAPKSGGLWNDVRQEIATAVSQAGGRSQEADGPFGTELRAQVPGEPGELQPIRFIGVDGPRWFLRGVITGPAARHAAAAAPFEELFAGLVVVRGD